MSSTFDMPSPKLVRITLAASVVLFLLRFSLAADVGFGDAEALYATYALYRQASYLDHPGLIGWLGSLLAANGSAPSPTAAHHFTAAAATAFPWIGGLAARAAGASWRGVLIAVLVLLLAPEMAIGLFAFTPDVPLAIAWVSALGFAALALRSAPGSTPAFAATVAAGLMTGIACASKVSGILLGIGLLATLLSRPVRGRLWTAGPYAALIVGVVPVLPVLVREWRLGFPMLEHRLLHTQASFGPTLRNVGALVGGQLLYVTPFMLAAAVLLAVDLAKQSRRDEVSRLLFFTTFIPLAFLSVLTVLSKVAEPHWIAPAYVALVLHLSRRLDEAPGIISRRLGYASLITAAVAIAAVFLVVRFPVLPKVLGEHYEPRYDLINDLYVWQPASELVQQNVANARAEGFDQLVVVGPHWVVCAQLQAALGSTARVGCSTDIGDDFQTFFPPAQWMHAPVLIFVTDDRFPEDPKTRFPDRAIRSVDRLGVRRGGAVVRTVRVMQLVRTGAG